MLTAERVTRKLGHTIRTATNALAELVDAEILEAHIAPGPRTPGRPARLYVSPDLLALTGTGAAR